LQSATKQTEGERGKRRGEREKGRADALGFSEGRKEKGKKENPRMPLKIFHCAATKKKRRKEKRKVPTAKALN